jgi:hypothetical protein
MDCVGYIIVNAVHKGGNKDDDNGNNNNNKDTTNVAPEI